MITPKTLQKYPFFSMLNDRQLNYLINAAHEENVKQGEFVCKINRKLDHFFLVLSGQMEVLFEVPKIQKDFTSPQKPSQLENEFVSIARLNPGEICGWSALVPPHISTSSVMAITPSTIIVFDSTELLKLFEKDCRFGYFMLQAAAQAIGKRLQAIYHLPDFR